MGIEENKNVVKSFYEAGNRGDMDTCFGLIADDITWTSIGSTVFSGTFTGKDQLMQQLLGPLFGNLKAGISSTIKNLIAEGDVVVAETSGIAETTDGKPYNNSYCQIMTIRDGQIVKVTEYADTALINSTFENI